MLRKSGLVYQMFKMLNDAFDVVVSQEHLLVVTSALSRRSDLHVLAEFSVDSFRLSFVDRLHEHFFVSEKKVDVFALLYLTPVALIGSITIFLSFLIFWWSTCFS